MKVTTMVILLVAALGAPPVLAQDAPADNMEILRDKLKADKKLIVAANMDLTEGEAKGFWPVYDGYQKDLQQINQRLGKLIDGYVGGYDTLTDDAAKKMTDEFLAIQDEEVKLMKTTAPKLSKVLPAKKVARYLQIENKIRAVLKYELADAIPLVQ